ncbi:APC family permease [Paraburkholderia nemoris]|uniref:APC family permease n=1 Tax=Paraburkholderia nemoris TaxID=2793076 RepID=UPI0038B81E34
MTTKEVNASAEADGLKRNALGLISAMGMSLAFISPTIGVMFISALIGGKAGVSSPFVFVLGTAGIALMALTIAEFAKRVTSAGGFYKFITLGLGPEAGFAAGMLMLFAYALQSPINTNLFGGFLSNALRNDFGITVPWWALMIGVVVLVGILAWYSVHASMQFDVALLIAEVVVVGGLLIVIVFKGGDAGQVPESFSPTHADQGFGGIGQAFVFIVMAFFGFESCLTVAEECRNPRRNLPIALIGSVVLAGLWFTFAMYSIVVGYGSAHMDKLANSQEPIHDLAVRYLGHMYGNLVDLAAVSAIVAVVLAIHTANFRVLYSLGRDGLLHKALGRTHPKHKTPHVAIIVYSILTLVVGIGAGFWWDPMSAFGNLGYLSSLGMLPILILTNVALPVFMWKRYRAEFSLVLHVAFPVISNVIFLAAIWLNVHPWPAAPLTVFPWIVVAVIVLAALWGRQLKRRGSPAFYRLGAVLFIEGDAIPEMVDVEIESLDELPPGSATMGGADKALGYGNEAA